MDGHAVGHRRPPGGIGARVEIAGEIDGEKLAVWKPPSAGADPRGWRLVVHMIHSAASRPCAPADRVTHAASAMKGCTDISSLEPKPPPTAVGMIRTAPANAEDAWRCRRDS